MNRANDKFYIPLDCKVNNSLKYPNDAVTGNTEELLQCPHSLTDHCPRAVLDTLHLQGTFTRKSGEDIQRETIRHRLIPSTIRMKIIPTVIPRSNLRRSRGIPNNPVKINDSIERPTGQDPCIDSLSRRLACRVRIRLSRPRKRRDRSGEDGDPGAARIGGDLRECCDQAVPGSGLGPSVGRGCADVVDAFEDHDVLDAGLLDGVASVPADEARAQAVLEDAVAACGLVVHADLGELAVLHSCEEEVGPSVGHQFELQQNRREDLVTDCSRRHHSHGRP